MPVALGVLSLATLARPCASRAQATHTTPGMEEVACVRNKQSRDVGR